MSFIRLISKFISKKLIINISDSEHGEYIMFFITLTVSIVCGYALVYNLAGFPNIKDQQMTGIIILAIILLIFIAGTIFFGLGSLSRFMLILSEKNTRNAGPSPMEGGRFIGHTRLDGNKYSLYKKQDGYFLRSFKRAKGFENQNNYLIRSIEKDEIGEVYVETEYCCYKSHEF